MTKFVLITTKRHSEVPLANQIVNSTTFLTATSGCFFKNLPCFQGGRSVEWSLWSILIKTLLEILMKIRNQIISNASIEQESDFI